MTNVIPILEEYERDFPDMKGEMLVVHINIFILSLSYIKLIYCLYIWVVDGDEGLMVKWGWILDEGERKGYEEEEIRLKEEEEGFREQSRNLQVCNYILFLFYLVRYPSLSLLRIVNLKSCMIDFKMEDPLL